MITPINSLKDRLDLFEDTEEICRALNNIAESDYIESTDIYWLKETVCSLNGLYDLARSAVFHATKHKVSK